MNLIRKFEVESIKSISQLISKHLLNIYKKCFGLCNFLCNREVTTRQASVVTHGTLS